MEYTSTNPPTTLSSQTHFSKSGITITQQSNDNTITNNQFATERSYYGVSLFQSFNNQITDNTIYNFSTGLELSNAENNLIARNVVTSKFHAAEIFMFNNNTFDSNQFLGATDIWDMGPNTGHPASINTWILSGISFCR